MMLFIQKAGRWIWRTLAVLFIFIAIVFVTTRALTPYLNDHLPDFEGWASQAFKKPVKIERAYLRWVGYQPALTFDRVKILNLKTHAPIIAIRQLKLTFNLIKSLILRKILFDAMSISGVNLTIREQENGDMNIVGLYQVVVSDTLTGASLHSNEVLDWIFSQAKLSLNDIEIQFMPQKGDPSIVRINHASLKNNDIHHILKGMLTLQQDLPTSMKLQIDWYGKTDDLEHAAAHFSITMDSVALTQWFKNKSWRDWQIKEGMGSATVSLDWKENTWQNIQAQFQIYDLLFSSTKYKESQAIPRINGNLSWQRDGTNQIISGDKVLINLPNHVWPTINFSMILSPTKENNLTLKSVQTTYIDLNDVAKLFIHSHLSSDSLNQLIVSLNPRGEAKNITLSMLQANPIQAQNLVLTGQLQQVSFNAWQNYPGVENLSGQINWNGIRGDIKLDSKKIQLTYAKLFETPLQFDQLSGDLSINQKAPQVWIFSAKELEFINPDLKLSANIKVELPASNNPIIQASSHFSVLQAQNMQHYLPLPILDTNLSQWLKQAFHGGQIDSGEIIVEGDLSHYPFSHGNGKIQVNTHLKNVEFNFAPGWPMLHTMTGTLVFDNNIISIAANSGKIMDAPLTQVHATITNVGLAGPTILSIVGDIDSDIKQGLDFIHHSPLDKTIGVALGEMVLTGPMQLKLALEIPLAKLDAVKVNGAMTLTNIKLLLPSWHLTATKLSGLIHFKENSIESKKITGNLLDEPAVVVLTTQFSKDIKNKVVHANIQSQLNIAGIQNWLGVPLTKFAQGKAPYQAELEIASQSNTAHSINFILQTNLRGIALKLPAPYSKEASQAKNLNLELTVSKNEALQSQVTYGDLNLQLMDAKDVWHIDVTNKNMDGEIDFPKNYTRNSTIYAHFKRLGLTSLIQQSKSSLNPMNIPAITFEGDSVSYGDKKLGHIDLKIVPSSVGLVIESLTINSGLSKMQAHGNWKANGNVSQTSLQGKIETDQLTELLSSWGFDSSNLSAKHAFTEFDLQWPDAPYHATLTNLSGKIMIKIGKGQILGLSDADATKIGIGRMLNILSLESIPRRLSLDFSDLSGKGYNFDYINSDISLKGGNAYTDDVHISGPVARIDLSGRIGLQQKDYDLNLSITPFVTSSLPVVVGVFNPVAGVAAWVANKVFVSKEISKAATYHYKVTGPWSHPQWEKASLATKLESSKHH